MIDRIAGAVVAAILLWIVAGAVRALLGDRPRWGSLDPVTRIRAARRPRLDAVAMLVAAVSMAVTVWLARIPAAGEAFAVSLGLMLAAAVTMLVAEWPQAAPPPPEHYSAPRWLPDPTGASADEWYWNGSVWTSLRRPPGSTATATAQRHRRRWTALGAGLAAALLALSFAVAVLPRAGVVGTCASKAWADAAEADLASAAVFGPDADVMRWDCDDSGIVEVTASAPDGQAALTTMASGLEARGWRVASERGPCLEKTLDGRLSSARLRWEPDDGPDLVGATAAPWGCALVA